MNIKCSNITAKYPTNIKQQLYNLKDCLKNQPASHKNCYPLFDVSCTFNKGVNIILGSNSSGKSTLLRLLAGILRPAAGTIRFNGQIITDKELRQLISYLPQTFDLYPDFTAYEMLEYIAILKGSNHSYNRANSIKQVLLATNLLPAAQQKVKTYSRGMKQRLGIAQALLNHTSILILDEPTASLDPEERNKFRRLMATLGQSRLILFSSSILTDIVCANTTVILHHGECRFTGTPAALAAYGKQAAVTEINEQKAFTSNLQRGYQAVLSGVKPQ